MLRLVSEERSAFSQRSPNRHHIALISTTNARITISTESPISNQMGFVFRDIKLPIRAPLIDPTITNKAGRNIMLPRDQKTIAPGTAVKIVTNKDVAIAFRTSSPIIFKKGGNKLPPLPPRIIVRKLRKNAPPIIVFAFGLIF